MLSVRALWYTTSRPIATCLIMEGKRLLMSEFPDLKMLQVRSFLIDHLGQELVLQTIPGHSKIDEGGLGLNLWLVVRIGQLGVEDESEAWVEETLLIPNFYTAVRERHRDR